MQVNAGMLESADFHLGRLIQHLESKGQLDNTIVIVTSDNGPEYNTLGKTSKPAVKAFEKFWMAIEGWDVTGVTNRQIKQLGIEVTPKHPETEMRKAGAKFESKTATIEMLAAHIVVDGNIVTGQNQNSGYETSHRILEIIDNQISQCKEISRQYSD